MLTLLLYFNFHFHGSLNSFSVTKKNNLPFVSLKNI